MSSVAPLLADEITALEKSSPSPRSDAALLLAHVLDRPREWLIAHGEAAVSTNEESAFRALCRRRRTGIPIAYLTGTAWFYGREFVVNQSVLVPRPESEHLIDEALAFIRGPMGVLDVGTGSGAIACTIAAESAAIVDATDSSAVAIEHAWRNAVRLGVAERCRFYHGDLAEPAGENRYDVVIANLPYVPTSEIPKRPDPASFEPRSALDGGPDGLVHYRNLLPQLPALLNPSALVLLECAPPTIKKLAVLVRTTLPKFVIEECNDYAGLPRYLKAVDRRPAELRGASAASEAARSPGGRERG